MFNATTDIVINKYAPLGDGCDDMFLIFDTARHVDVRVTGRECSDHVRSCADCRAELGRRA